MLTESQLEWRAMMKHFRVAGWRLLLLLLSAQVCTVQYSAQAGPTNPAGNTCLVFNEAGSDCGFSSYSQCEATASGVGVECYGPSEQKLAARAQLRPALRDVGRGHVDGYRPHVRRHN
jgi:hypothetical protein